MKIDAQIPLFELPPPAPKKQVAKRSIQKPDTSTLKEQQALVYNGLMKFLQKPGGGMVLLNGYAGVGKSYVMAMVIESYLYMPPSGARSYMVEVPVLPGSARPLKRTEYARNIASTATTNKAVRVAYNMATYAHPRLEHTTIHKLLGLREVIQADGSISFMQDKMNVPNLQEYRVVIVDEVSMLSNELIQGNNHTKGLLQYVEELGLKVIFVGDQAQIPAVNAPECLVFDENERERLGIEYFTMTEVVRQAADNPILAFATMVRNNLHRMAEFGGETTLKGGKGVISLMKTNPDHEEYLVGLLKHLFCSANFNANPDFAKVIAWRNKTVDYMNRIIRRFIYGRKDLNRIEVGEKIVTRQPVFEEKKIIMPTNEELEVLSYKEQQEVIQIGEDEVVLPYYLTLVQYYNLDNTISKRYIKILTDEGVEMHKELLSLLADNAKSLPKGSTSAYIAWAKFYETDRMFAAINYNYCITAHLSQGSTYANVIVMEYDIQQNRKIKERNRILYTSFSRASDRLWIFS